MPCCWTHDIIPETAAAEATPVSTTAVMACNEAPDDEPCPELSEERCTDETAGAAG